MCIRDSHRAQAFTDNICDLWTCGQEELVARRIARSDAVLEQCLKLLYLHWAEECARPDMRRAYLAAARGRYGLDGPEA